VGEAMTRFPVAKITLLLFGSGFCALVYQVAWLRLLRLIFGSSTPATAAVVAIFMGGLGAGSLLLGPRADRQVSPLNFYARLELGIAASAALSPVLIQFARWLYIAVGGSTQLGALGGTLVRIVLAGLVLGLPTFLMGGTLPAVTRAVERGEDQGRRLLGLLYGANTLGAVLGALATTFFSIEVLGINRSIWVASLINLLVALLAGALARRLQALPSTAADPAASGTVSAESDAPRRPLVFRFVLVAAAAVGFVFFLMELVWYRMLAPLLGGSSYTFGLILAVALLGIGLGGLLYGAGARHRRPTLSAFALTCSLEAFFLIVPFALGDKLAVTTLVLRDLGGVGFTGLVVSWSWVVGLIVLPPALVAGYQFPMLVAILGSGRKRVGSEVGWTYASNTAGAIAGSLAGGFGLLPLLSATGAWRLSAVMLVVLAAIAALVGAQLQGRLKTATAPLLLGALVLMITSAPGPTAFWRHNPIGAGRVKMEISDVNQLRDAIHRKNRMMLWQTDGLESSIAMQSSDGAAFMINGKVDGHARGDAPMQVMSGLMGAALHPDPRTALIIGLGTGSTAGWLAQVPTLERVDVVELEPAILRVAEDCEVVNLGVLTNPKVRMFIGDGREVLLTTPERYDVVFSEPSNPYRAGIASLFTRDFYEAVSDRLSDNGLLVQWLQGYEVDGQIVRTALATLGIVFETVETWQINQADLLLLASNHPIQHDPTRLRERLQEEPYKTAMNRVWGVEGAEGFYAGFIASDDFTRAVLDQEKRWINTDDRPIIEFGFARNLGRQGLFQVRDLISLVDQRRENRPPGVDETDLDWSLVMDLRAARSIASSQVPILPSGIPDELKSRIVARRFYAAQDLPRTCVSWFSQPEEPQAPIDFLMIAECLAENGDEQALVYAKALEDMGRGIEAEATRSRWAIRSGQPDKGAQHLIAALEDYRSDPWPHPPAMKRLLQLAAELAGSQPQLGRALFAAMEEPFALDMEGEVRRAVLFDIARTSDFDTLCLSALEQYGEWVPWEERFLRERLRCLQQHDDPRSDQARRDLESFLAEAPFPLERGLTASPD